MKRLENLPEITEHGLGGLVADEKLKQRILDAANQPARQTKVHRFPAQRIGSIAAAAAALIIGLGTGIPAVLRQPAQNQEVPEIMARALVTAAAESTQAPENVIAEQVEEVLLMEDIEVMQNGIALSNAVMLDMEPVADESSDMESFAVSGSITLDAEQEESAEEAMPDAIGFVTTNAGSDGQQQTADMMLKADLGRGAVVVEAKKNAYGYRSIWEENVSGAFPMICVDGRYYRALSVPAQLSGSLLGNELGAVTTHTTEPALAGTKGIISNSVSEGARVFTVSGFDGALIAAEKNGSFRVYQRVSFNGTALRGKEKLADTLCIAGHIIGMDLSGVGVVTDVNVCESLYATLVKNAVYESSGSLTASGSLLIQLDNGLAVQLDVKDENLSACGVWSCPEFFEAFAKQAR